MGAGPPDAVPGSDPVTVADRAIPRSPGPSARAVAALTRLRA
jgi:hypothetical protein